MDNMVTSFNASIPDPADVHVGFVVTNPYQLFHYGAIRRHLRGEVSVYVDVRPDDLGLNREVLSDHLGACPIHWVGSMDLREIDGSCDVIVAQTPVPVLKIFEKSLVVAQQYSLAKERYQYGGWRAQADLNLMYGDYSRSVIAPISSAVAVGNPLFDGHVEEGQALPLREAASGRLRVLYMPTYGDLSDRSAVVKGLVRNDVDLTIKAHHADLEIASLADRLGARVVMADANPIEQILQNDLVVSDYSGAIYDALAMRTPVALADSFNVQSKNVARLSDDDISRASVADLASGWVPGEPLQRAYEESRSKLADDALYGAFRERFYVNFGAAGRACAQEIEKLAATGPQFDFLAVQVREVTRRYIVRNRLLQQQLAEYKRNSATRSPGLGGRARAGAKRLVLALPGGDRVIERIQETRRRGAIKAMGPAAVVPVEGKLTLSPLAHIRRRQTMQVLSDKLTDAGVDHRTFANEYTAYIGVRSEDTDVLHRALRSLDPVEIGPIQFWIGTGANYATVRDPQTISMLDIARCESLVAGVPYRNGDYWIEANGGVEVLILQPRQARLVSSRARAEKTDWTKDFEDEPGALGVERGNVPFASAGVGETVDVVYTWVDSSDPNWKLQHAQWSGQNDFTMPSAANDERYINRDELRYSLRSLQMYAPFVGNIYVVTNGQRPPWLVEDNDRIRVIRHDQIFPDPAVLPTFNSHSIEACLHRIPGLAENFLYFNDDVFLGEDTRFEDFYSIAGLIKSRFSPSTFVAADRPSPDAIPTDWASYNAVLLMQREFGISFERKHKHVPLVLKKSLLEEMEGRFPEVFERTRTSRFRAHEDYAIPSMLAQYYAIATRQGVEWENTAKEYAYADTGRKDFASRLQKILIDRPKFICLNVTIHDDLDFATQEELIRDFLKQRYPIPSPYEVEPG